MGARARIAAGDESSCTSPISALLCRLFLLNLPVCLSSSRCSRSFLLSTRVLQLIFSWLPLVSDLRPCLTSRPNQPPTPLSRAWRCSSSKEHLISGPFWPSSHLSWTTFFSQTTRPKPKQSHFIADLTPCTDCICICIASNRIALHGITSNIHTPLSLPHSGPSPCIQLPDPAASRASRPYQPPRPNPHLAPLYNEPSLAVLCSVWPQLILHLSARLRRRSRPWLPSRPVIFLCHPLRAIIHQHPPCGRPNQAESHRLTASWNWNRQRPFSSPVLLAFLKHSFELQLWALLGHSLSILYLPGHKSWNTLTQGHVSCDRPLQRPHHQLLSLTRPKT